MKRCCLQKSRGASRLKRARRGFWWRYVGSGGRVHGIDEFGASGKGPELFKKYGFGADTIAKLVLESSR